MFSFINGRVAEAGEGFLVLENNGIGYELLVSSYTLQANSQIGKEVKLYCYFQVRDDGVSLFGFSSREEKNMFVRLISVSGVGCKAAISVLSGISISDLAICIATGDSQKLTTVKGVGKKTAERIILELKEKVSVDLSDARLKLSESAAPLIAAGGDAEDAAMALVALGISKSDAAKCVDKAIAAGAQGLEQIISAALKSLY